MKSIKMTLTALSAVGVLTVSQAFATDWSAYSSKRPMESKTTSDKADKGGIDGDRLNSRRALVESKNATSESTKVDRTQVCSKKDMMSASQCATHCGM